MRAHPRTSCVCAAGGVYVPCIYPLARSELLYELTPFCVVDSEHALCGNAESVVLFQCATQVFVVMLV